MEVAQLIGIGASGLLGGGAIGAIVKAVIDKRIKSPADEQAQVEFGVKVLEDRLTEANADRAAMQSTIDWFQKRMDEYGVKSAEDFEVISALRQRIHAKDDIINDQSRRLERIADKVRRGVPVLMTDIFDEHTARGMEDLEETAARAEASS